MTEYSYKATTCEGKIVQGVLDAENERSAMLKLQGLGYVPVRIKLGADEKESFFSAETWSFRKSKIKTRDLLIFTQELNTLLTAGLPLDRSLMILRDLAENEKFREIVHEIIQHIKGGKSLADAMAEHPAVFPKVYVNMVKAGEMGGVLPKALSDISAYLERSSELKTFVVSSLIYPTVIFFTLAGSMLIMIFVVIPKFAQVFDSSGAPLPLPMQILLGISDFFINWWWALLLGLFLLVVWITRWRRSESGRYYLDAKLLKIPALGRLINRIEVARFSRTLGTLLQNAVPLISALSLVKEVVNNMVVAHAIEPIKTGVKKGEGLVSPMRKTAVFPPLSLHLLEVGEETGNLPAMLLRAAEVYENEVRIEIKRFLTLFEPLMILLMGVLVGIIIVSMVYSIFSIYEIPM
ncbi:MAG: type II secretion system F family protein [Acidobacteria bacterium]|nr:type II secretion system F family protein [Acidobacteriota bacterium]